MALPDRPLSRKEEYLAAIAGEEGVKPDRPLSRTEEYLEAIDEYLDTKANLVDGKVPASELPSYVDDVVEYEDLAHFPAEGEKGKIYVALDTNFTYRWSGSEYIQIGGGGSQITVLTNADYNYPENNPSRVSLALLSDGMYVVGDSAGARTFIHNTDSSCRLNSGDYAIVTTPIAGSSTRYIYVYRCNQQNITAETTGATYGIVKKLPSGVVNSLSSYLDSDALSANQGRVLKETIDNRIRVESSAPTTSTSGALGQLWIDNTGPTIYILSSISGSTYTWTHLMA